jgi:uncharacterized membrane protein
MKAVVWGLMIVALAACGGSGGSCPNDLPASCPSSPPSYQGAIAPLISARCLICHSPGGQEQSIPFTTYQNVFAERSPMLDQVYACNMPPAGAQQLSSQERNLLLTWLVCGAPNN